jgi:hypothetical protein
MLIIFGRTSWITLPTAIYCTLNHVKVDSPNFVLSRGEKHVLPALLKAMMTRFQGAELACILIKECTEESSPEQIEDSRFNEVNRPARQGWDQASGFPASGIPVGASSIKAESMLLSRVVKSINSGLANDVSDKVCQSLSP